MCVKPPSRDLNSDSCLPHLTSIYTYRVTTALGGPIEHIFRNAKKYSKICYTIFVAFKDPRKDHNYDL